MNSTLTDWDTRLRISFERLQSSEIPPFSNDHIRHWLVIIGLMTIALLLFLLFVRFISKIRQIYRSTDLKKQYPKSRTSYSCYPRCQCVKPTVHTRQIFNNYEPVSNVTSYISVHTV